MKVLLLVEDNPGDVRLFREMFNEQGPHNTRMTHVNCMGDAEKYLTERPVDIILLDLGLPDVQGLSAVRRARAAAPRVPLVVLTGLDDELLAALALQQGAQDYLIKGQIETRGLLRALRYAIERNIMEEALFEEKERAQVTLNSIGDAVGCTDTAGRITFLNLVAEKMTGWPGREATGRPIAEIFRILDATSREVAQASTETAVGQDRSVRLPSNCVLIRRDGSEIPVEDSVSPIHDRQGRATGSVIVLRDVSHARAAAKQMIERRAAEAANEAKSQFLATLTHELRTPLTGIIGFSELMLRADFDPAELTRFLELQRDAGHVLLALVNDILDLSKIEAGKLELQAVPIDLRSIVVGCEALAAHSAETKGLLLYTTIDEAVPRHLLGDPTRLRQIILNLLTNAVKFTDAGSIQLAVEMVEPTPGERRVRVGVTDTGIGIPADRLGRLFREFSQVHDVAARRQGGSGLGLAICQRLVALMGGKIGVSSAEGRGSVFWFEVPLAEARERVETTTVLPADTIPPLRILLAEDSPMIQTLVVAVLETAGHQVQLVENGALAVEVAAAASFDLILMDLNMPIMDGLEAAGRIRAAESGRRRVPIVALTANATSRDLERCTAAGMDGFLTKPIDLDLLLTTIGRLGARN